MALDFQNIPVVFGSGIDRTDPYLLSPGKLMVLQNAVFEDAQTIITRAGTHGLSLAPAVASIPSPYTRTNPSFTGTPYRMAQNQGNLLLEGVNGLFARSPYNSGTSATEDISDTLQIRTDSGTSTPGRADFTRGSVETDFVGQMADLTTDGYPVSGSLDQGIGYGRIENYDGNGRAMTMVAWLEYVSILPAQEQRMRIRVFDEGVSTQSPQPGVSGRTQILDLTIPTNEYYGFLRVVSSSTDFYVLVIDALPANRDLLCPFRFTAATGTVSYPTLNIPITGSVMAFDAVWDPDASRIVLTWSEDSSGPFLLSVGYCNAAVSSVTSTSFTTTGAINTLSLLITKSLTSPKTRYQALYTCVGTESTLRGVWWTLTGGSSTRTETTVLAAASALGRVTAIDTELATSDSFLTFVDLDRDASSLANIQGITQIIVDKDTLASSSLTVTSLCCHIYGRPSQYGSAVYLPACYIQDEIYPSIFVLVTSKTTSALANAVVGARIHWGAAGNIYQNWYETQPIPFSFMSGSTLMMTATRDNAQTSASRAGIGSPTQIWQARVNFTTQDVGFAEANRLTVMAGACPQQFDGNFFEEVGFNHRPVIISAVASGVSGNLSTGTYSLCATYVHTDAQGNTTESMPSEVVTFAAVAGASDSYTATVLNPGLTAKNGIKIRLYRSEANGATLYLDTDATNGVLSDGTTDALITANTRVPTDGGVLPNQPMPASRVVVEHDDRLWCAGGEAGDIIYFSQNISEDLEPEWNRALARRVPRNAGRVVNMVSLDDKLVIFCEKRIGFIYGEGPSRAGAQDGYSQFIESVSGYAIPWEEPHSIVRATDGVWFRCGFGFRLLGRNMQIVKTNGNDLASELDAILKADRTASSVTVVRALIGSTAQQVRFYMSDATVYVYDMLYNQWSQFTGFSAVDCTSIGEDYYHVTSTPELFVQTPSAIFDSPGFGENDTAITTTITTAWLSFAGLQGFQRVNRIMLLGQLSALDSSGYTVTVQAAYNFVDATLTTIYSGPFLRGGASSSTVIQIEMQPTTQKCESIQLKITLVPVEVASDGTRPLRLTSANLLVGLKKGRYKLPTANKV